MHGRITFIYSILADDSQVYVTTPAMDSAAAVVRLSVAIADIND